MDNKIEYWANRSHEANVRKALFLKNHKVRLEALLIIDPSKLSEPSQKQHQSKINYLQSVIETVEELHEIITGLAMAYRNNLLTPEQKLKIMEATNPALNTLINKFDLIIKP